jgi:hypothetical protein
LTQAAVVIERKATGEVCLSDGEHGHQHQETPVGAGPRSQWSALPTCIELQIDVGSPYRYSDGQNQWSSGECRQ